MNNIFFSIVIPTYNSKKTNNHTKSYKKRMSVLKKNQIKKQIILKVFGVK